MITVKHLSKTFDNCGNPLTVLKDINCEIHKGEVISIIGPSGTGKSTFLRCLNRLENPTGCEIIVDGVNIMDKKTDLAKVRRKMGMVFQNFNLFNHLTILENVSVGPIKLLGMSREEAEKQAMELLHMVGLASKAHAMPSDLSGGQKQRVAIARALITHPQILLADEPTGALDSKTSAEVMEYLGRINREYGATLIVVTHESGVANCTDKIIHIKDGVIGEIEQNTRHDASAFGTSTIMK